MFLWKECSLTIPAITCEKSRFWTKIENLRKALRFCRSSKFPEDFWRFWWCNLDFILLRRFFVGAEQIYFAFKCWGQLYVVSTSKFANRFFHTLTNSCVFRKAEFERPKGTSEKNATWRLWNRQEKNLDTTYRFWSMFEN